MGGVRSIQGTQHTGSPTSFGVVHRLSPKVDIRVCPWMEGVCPWMEGVCPWMEGVLEWEVCVLESKVCVLEWEGGAVGWCGLGVWLISVNCCLFAGIKKAARRLLFLVSGLSDQNVKNELLSMDTLSDCMSTVPFWKLPSTLALSLLPKSPPVTVNISSSSSSSAA